MKRLMKQADNVDIIGDAQKLLDRIDQASDQLKDAYYALFDNLNALFDTYPDLYKEMQMTIKLPTNKDAENVVKFNQDLHDVLSHFQDKNYLSSYIQKQSKEP